MISRLTVLFLLASTLSLANAATYYVDASAGKDSWSGTQPSTVGSPATDGPWQSLAKVSATALSPGDSVSLKCGGVWNETLTLQSSGTADSPITIGAYPSDCTNKPTISGATPIPAHNWIRDTGNIYKLPSEIDLITYGTFENGLGNWTKWAQANNASMNLSNSCASAGSCMSFTAGSTNSILISNNFPLIAKQAYTATFNIKAPVGAAIRVIVRRNAPPWNGLGLDTAITGTGNWQTFTLPFIAPASIASSRLDFEVPAGRNIGLDNVKITSTLSSTLGVFDNGKSINIAHHPNRGHDPLRPESLFFAISENADQVSLTYGGKGSTYLTTGTDLAAQAHPTITAGTGIRIRTNAWTISDRKIASVSGSQLFLDSPTTYPIEKNWGYFLYGQRWMLDEPGEWHYDAATKTTYVWMADNAAPGSRISVGQGATGIEANNLSHIRVENLAIQNVGTGVRMAKATDIVLRNLTISDTLGAGLDAAPSTDSGVENSQISRTAGDAISAAKADASSLRFHAYDNLITDSGVQTKNGVPTTLPMPTRAAIDAGRSADLRNNQVYGTGYIGIWMLNNSLVSGNHIEDACLILDDCGAIYTSGQDNNSTIENNTIHHVVGGLSGRPANHRSQSQGIYLDELTDGATVRGNTVADADNGIQLHNAANNQIEDNTLYGNRRYQIWFHEQSNRLMASGDVYDNTVLSNRLFPTLAAPSVSHWTELPNDNTQLFASYNSNRYFTLLSPAMASETWSGGGRNYTLPQWQTANSTNSLPRNLDPAGSEVNGASIGYAVFHTSGGNIVPNGNLSAGKAGWTAWNATAPNGMLALEACTPASQCLRYTAGSSESLVSSPNFSVQKDQWYKVSFDLKTSTNGQSVSVMARRGGGGSNGYELLMGVPINFTGKVNWQRYGFIFKATKTINANDPVTLDLGARIDFTRLQPGQMLTLANLEAVPISSVETSFRSHILINPTSTELALDCPDGENAVSCSEYVRFSDNQIVSWPYDLPPNGSEIIYSRDFNLIDSDGDGIPDYQDFCNGTGALLAVNANGCGLGQ